MVVGLLFIGIMYQKSIRLASLDSKNPSLILTTYTGKNFTFQYPQAWSLTTDTSNGYEIINIQNKVNATDNPSTCSSIAQLQFLGPVPYKGDFTTFVQNDPPAVETAFKLTDIKVNNKISYKREYTNNATCQTADYYVKQDNKKYLLISSTVDITRSELMNTIDNTIQSLTIFSKSN